MNNSLKLFLAKMNAIVKRDERYKAKQRIELESYNDYPDAVSNNAQRGIDLNKEVNNRCATQVGKIRAQQLAQKKPISAETIKRMYAYLSRAEEFYNEDDKTACGTISYLLWGGKAAKRWSEAKLKELGLFEGNVKLASGQRVSFDFDDVLDTPRGERLFYEERAKGSDIYIVTRRNKAFSGQVYFLANRLGIPRDHIYFTSGQLKWMQLFRLNISKHYDSSQNEIDKIKQFVPSIQTVKV